ncbi:MAG: DUF2029 domain-containing protein [Chloroflexi bacterium]|nr:DUF2029 domain-containing protein [Chloroflexota bacterium]
MNFIGRFYDTSYLKQKRSSSKLFRRLLWAAIIFAVFRLLAQVAIVFDPELYPDDLRIYLDAARDVTDQRDLYPSLPLQHMEFYQYAPSFALTFVSFLWMSKPVAALVHIVLHLLIYTLLFLRWDRMFKQWGIEQGRAMLAWTLPAWLVFAVFWNDMAYLNVYLLTALLATLLIEAVINERLGPAVLWLSVIAQIKPQWAFAAAIPLLLGRYRFFARLIGLAGVIYVAVCGITIVIMGVDYGWEQHKAYFHLLTQIGDTYPWRGPDEPFLGYNHSIPQIAVYILGDNTSALRVAYLIRAVLLIPLAIIVLRCLRQPARRPGYELPRFSLDLAFALYTGVFIWLEVVWELALGIAVFTYLLATLEQQRLRRMVEAVFIPYVLLDAIQIISVFLFWDAVMDESESYVLTDPSIYIPLVMIVTVVFHALLVGRLWNTGKKITAE